MASRASASMALAIVYYLMARCSTLQSIAPRQFNSLEKHQLGRSLSGLGCLHRTGPPLSLTHYDVYNCVYLHG